MKTPFEIVSGLHIQAAIGLERNGSPRFGPLITFPVRNIFGPTTLWLGSSPAFQKLAENSMHFSKNRSKNKGKSALDRLSAFHCRHVI